MRSYNNPKLPTTADDKTTVVEGSDKSVVGSVSCGSACADRFNYALTQDAIILCWS